MHFVLAEHPDIGVPDNEIHFFDADDPVTHPDFFFVQKRELAWFDPGDPGALDWYASRFAPFAQRRLIGEDSTTYLFSEVAAHRIAALLPQAKLVFMLRHPVARAYSQYWHLVKTGRTSASFETALHREPSIILGSTYASHLRRYFDLFGRRRVLVVLFEDFVASPQDAVDRVTDFLGGSRMEVRPEQAWRNRTYYPGADVLQRHVNRFGRLVVRQRYRNHLAARRGFAETARKKMQYWWFERINPVFFTAERPPEMRAATRAYLSQHLAARNQGLSELLSRDLSVVWRDFSA